MKQYKVDISDKAQSDIKEIVAYISRELKNPPAAKILAAKLKAYILGLAEMPKKQNLVSDEVLSEKGIRKLLVDNYLVFYIIDDSEEKVTIIRALYSRRNWESLI